MMFATYVSLSFPSFGSDSGTVALLDFHRPLAIFWPALGPATAEGSFATLPCL